MVCGENTGQPPPDLHASAALAVTTNATVQVHPCQNFAFPPPPPGDRIRIGPRRKFVCVFLLL